MTAGPRVRYECSLVWSISLVARLSYRPLMSLREPRILRLTESNNTRTYAAGFQTATAVPPPLYGWESTDSANNNRRTNVANPFYIGNLSAFRRAIPFYYNVLSKSSYVTSKTISIANLVKSNPQLNTLRLYRPVGTSQFQEFQVNVSKRIGNGLRQHGLSKEPAT